MKFRKKPVVIEAVRWDGYTFWDGDLPCGGDGAHPEWLPFPVLEEGEVFKVGDAHHTTEGRLSIYTLEGPMLAMPGDSIIRGVKCEVYPCKPDIFDITYEPVEI